MKLNALMDNFGARQSATRVGRGMGSGSGKTAGRGHKGQKARSGSRKQATFQGGQMPILRRFPKFGFNNPFAKEYVTINLGDIEKFIASGKIDCDIFFGKWIVETKLWETTQDWHLSTLERCLFTRSTACLLTFVSTTRCFTIT